MHRDLFTYDPIIGYRFVPGLTARVEHEAGGYLMQTNSSGFRCRHEFIPERRADKSRILLFGDSNTAGDGVSDRYRYGDVLEELLPDVEIYNFGLSGSGTDQQYLIYRDLAATIEHDLVVLCVYVENIRRVAAKYRLFIDAQGGQVVLAKPYFSLDPAGRLDLHHVPVPKEVDVHAMNSVDWKYVYGGRQLQSLRFARLRKTANVFGPRVKERLQRLTRYQPLPAYNRADDPDWRLMQAILLQWLSEVQTPMLICVLPTQYHVQGTVSAEAYLRRFLSLHQPPSLIIHDPLPEFLRVPHRIRRSFQFEHDPHFKPEAHRILAHSLAPSVLSLLRTPVG